MTRPHDDDRPEVDDGDALGDRVHRALASTVAGVSADETLLRRIEAELDGAGTAAAGARTRDARRRSTRLALPVLAAAALLLALAGIAVWGRGEPERVDVGVDPTTSQTTTTAAGSEEPAGTSDPDAPPMPSALAAVLTDGHLVALDLAAGERIELAFHGDPAAEVGVAAEVSFIDGVSVDLAGGWVYYSTCCEPAPGITYRVRLDGSTSEPELLAYGAYPSVSPDGRWLALGVANSLRVLSVDDPTRATSRELGGSIGEIAWSPLGDQIMVAFVEPFADPQGSLLGFHGVDEALSDLGGLDVDLSGFTSAGVPDPVSTGDDLQTWVGRSQDPSGWWTLWVSEQGDLYEGADFPPTRRLGRDELPRFLAADW